MVVEERFWSATHTPIPDERGEVAFILQHTVDVTELKRLEQAAKGAERSVLIEAGVLSRAQAVQEANRSLEAERFRMIAMFEQAPGFVCFLRGREQRFELANPAYLQLVGRDDILGKPVRQALPELEGQGFYELLDRVFTSGEPFVGRGMAAQLRRTAGAPLEQVYLDFVYQPIRGADGAVSGILVQGQDITEQRRAEAAREQLLEQAAQSARENERLYRAARRERGAVPDRRRDDAPARLDDPARRLPRLLQPALVRLHRPPPRRDRRRGLAEPVPPRRPRRGRPALAPLASRPASPTTSSTAAAATTASGAGSSAGRSRCATPTGRS